MQWLTGYSFAFIAVLLANGFQLGLQMLPFSGLCEINSYLVQSFKIKAFLKSLSSVFVLHMCCSNITFNVMTHTVGFKGKPSPCHLM